MTAGVSRSLATGVVVAVATALLSALPAAPQEPEGGLLGFRRGQRALPNTPYDGTFTFVRLRYGADAGYISRAFPWTHDYPFGERNFMRIVNEVTNLRGHIEETNILALDDPEIFKFPVVYMAEPGFWTISEQEASSFREYLLKGGFVIFDDFAAYRGGWENFEAAFRQVIPGARFIDLDAAHPIHSFFEIDSLEIVPQAYDEGPPVFRGVFEDNDPSKRLLAMINYNTDISEFWEFAGTGIRPLSETNEAYKIGVNYVMYGLTH
jgi:hypothetical protein